MGEGPASSAPTFFSLALRRLEKRVAPYQLLTLQSSFSPHHSGELPLHQASPLPLLHAFRSNPPQSHSHSPAPAPASSPVVPSLPGSSPTGPPRYALTVRSPAVLSRRTLKAGAFPPQPPEALPQARCLCPPQPHRGALKPSTLHMRAPRAHPQARCTPLYNPQARRHAWNLPLSRRTLKPGACPHPQPAPQAHFQARSLPLARRALLARPAPPRSAPRALPGVLPPAWRGLQARSAPLPAPTLRRAPRASGPLVPRLPGWTRPLMSGLSLPG